MNLNQSVLIFLVIVLYLSLPSCSLDRKAARKIDGKWKLASWTWEGRSPQALPGKSNQVGGIFTFRACKEARYYIIRCRGSEFGFYGNIKETAFLWDVNHRGTALSLVPLEDQSDLRRLFNGGDWNIEVLSKQHMVLVSENCPECLPVGKTRLEFIKNK